MMRGVVINNKGVKGAPNARTGGDGKECDDVPAILFGVCVKKKRSYECLREDENARTATKATSATMCGDTVWVEKEIIGRERT
jgi:hypothetical protein